jgi:hypothetical protein
MINLQDVDLSHARSVYMTANTPMYIIRNLRSDPEIVKIHLNNSGENILAEIIDRLQRLPLDFEDRILPLALLVALSLKQNRNLVVAAASAESAMYRWYKLVADCLVQQVRPTLVTNIIAPATFSVQKPVASSSKSTYSVIDLV